VARRAPVDVGCQCRLSVIPFDCRRPTTNCSGAAYPDDLVSNNCGIRIDQAGAEDRVTLAYRARAKDTKGLFTVDRVKPDQPGQPPLARRSGEFACSEGSACSEVRGSLELFEVRSAPRPLIRKGQSFFSLADVTLSQGPADPQPELLPFSNREVYSVILACNPRAMDSCSQALQIPVYDGDLVRACYSFGMNKAALDMYPAGIPAGSMTFRQFTARLGANGAEALFQKYHESATRCTRPFKNPAWTACLSAVLAEECYKAYVLGIRPDGWAAFFALKDVELTRYQDGFDLEKLGTAFARAHVGDGLVKALPQAGASACCGDDLALLAGTLFTVQRDLLLQFKSVVGTLGDNFARWLALDAVSQFKAQLRDQFISALNRVGMRGCAAEFAGKFV
jgi:hypothetical protein